MTTPSDNRKHSAWPGVIRDIFIKAFATGHIWPLAVIILGGGLIYKLDSADLKEVLTGLVTSGWFCVLGWGLLIAVLFGCKSLLAWRESIHQREMDRVSETKNLAVQKHFELQLPSSKKPE